MKKLALLVLAALLAAPLFTSCNKEKTPGENLDAANEATAEAAEDAKEAAADAADDAAKKIDDLLKK